MEQIKKIHEELMQTKPSYDQLKEENNTFRMEINRLKKEITEKDNLIKALEEKLDLKLSKEEEATLADNNDDQLYLSISDFSSNK